MGKYTELVESVLSEKRYKDYKIVKSDIKGRGPWMIELTTSDGKKETSFHKSKKEAEDWAKKYMNMKEGINEAKYPIYHKTYSGAVQAAVAMANKEGYDVDEDDWFDKVSAGPKKPSSGKTNILSVELLKGGKPTRKKLQIQVYNMDNKNYELNTYIG